MSKVAVMGDLGMDRYHIGTVRGLSAEAPIPILDVRARVSLPGMGANVLANCIRLGLDAYWIGTDPNATCPTKNRLVTPEGQQIARWDERDFCPTYIIEDLANLIDASALIVCDYGKGSITPELISYIKEVRIPVFVDTKQDPSPWIGSDVWLFPNQSEYSRYAKEYGWLPKVVLKKGAEGAVYMEFGSVILQSPSFCREVRCVNGAGDTFMSAFVAAMLTIENRVPESMDIANITAGLVVEQPFLHRMPNSEELKARIERYYAIKSNSAGSDIWRSIFGADGCDNSAAAPNMANTKQLEPGSPDDAVHGSECDPLEGSD
jgi:bifunctional ADP-heptose synthase (sugar kinase/adenylyltransferase)